jgi:hypothetical protein
MFKQLVKHKNTSIIFICILIVIVIAYYAFLSFSKEGLEGKKDNKSGKKDDKTGKKEKMNNKKDDKSDNKKEKMTDKATVDNVPAYKMKDSETILPVQSKTSIGPRTVGEPVDKHDDSKKVEPFSENKITTYKSF